MVAVELLPCLLSQVEELLGTPYGAAPLGELEHAPFQTAESLNQPVEPLAQVGTVDKGSRTNGPLTYQTLRGGQRQVGPGRKDLCKVRSGFDDQLTDGAWRSHLGIFRRPTQRIGQAHAAEPMDFQPRHRGQKVFLEPTLRRRSRCAWSWL